MKTPQIFMLVGGLLFVGGIVGGAASALAAENDTDAIQMFLTVALAMSPVAILMVVIGFYLKGLERKQAIISEQGIEALGIITKVKPNRNVRVNGRYPYQVVAYDFQASDGMSYSARKHLIPTKLVEERGLMVGGTVRVRYLPNEPDKSTVALD